MIKKNKILFIATIFFVSLTTLYAQTNNKQIDRIFQKIEQGLTEGNINKFSGYFNSRIVISLEESSSDYFSSNQAFYVLDEFFRKNKITQFSFKQIILVGDNPYAYGELESSTPASKMKHKVFVSLEFIFTDWKITQITIN